MKLSLDFVVSIGYRERVIFILSLAAAFLVMRFVSPRDRNEPVMPPARAPLSDYEAFGAMPIDRGNVWHDITDGGAVSFATLARFRRRYARKAA